MFIVTTTPNARHKLRQERHVSEEDRTSAITEFDQPSAPCRSYGACRSWRTPDYKHVAPDGAWIANWGRSPINMALLPELCC